MQEVPPDFMCLEAMEDQEDPDARQDEDSRWGGGEGGWREGGGKKDRSGRVVLREGTKKGEEDSEERI